MCAIQLEASARPMNPKAVISKFLLRCAAFLAAPTRRPTLPSTPSCTSSPQVYEYMSGTMAVLFERAHGAKYVYQDTTSASTTYEFGFLQVRPCLCCAQNKTTLQRTQIHGVLVVFKTAALVVNYRVFGRNSCGYLVITQFYSPFFSS